MTQYNTASLCLTSSLAISSLPFPGRDCGDKGKERKGKVFLREILERFSEGLFGGLFCGALWEGREGRGKGRERGLLFVLLCLLLLRLLLRLDLDLSIALPQSQSWS